MKAATPPIVPCNKCQGTGRHALSDCLWETLQAVRRAKFATAIDLLRAMKWQGAVTALNNRLEDLRELGLLKRERRGKFYFYSPSKP